MVDKKHIRGRPPKDFNSLLRDQKFLKSLRMSGMLIYFNSLLRDQWSCVFSNDQIVKSISILSCEISIWGEVVNFFRVLHFNSLLRDQVPENS